MAVRVGALASAGTMPLAVSAQPLAAIGGTHRVLALGVARHKGRNFRLAVRVQRQELFDSPLVRAIMKKAKNDVDLRMIGKVVKQADVKRPPVKGMRILTSQPGLQAFAAGGPWYRRNVRPLNVGASIGHFRITAGTLGAFARQGNATCILSNNHVLANENQCTKGDAILQRGAYDGGALPADQVAKLLNWQLLVSGGTNYIDAALAEVDPSMAFDTSRLRRIYKGSDRKLKGVSSDPLDIADRVYKVGRTTGPTAGRVTAFDIDNVVVGYDPGLGNLRFDNQIEIEGAGQLPFSLGGDSGSLIVNGKMEAVALLFAGSEQGGHNNRGLTYASPIERVLNDLHATLLA